MCNIRWPTQNDTRGNSIVLCLPFIVVMIALVQLTFMQNINFTSTMNHFRIRGVRDSLVNNIKGYSSMPSTFRSSLQANNFSSNPDLQNCVFGTGASPCQPGVELPVTLYSPISSSMIISGPAALNGAQTQAALYDAKGNLCANVMGSATTQCPFEVTTSFVATCAPGQTSCATAQSIQIHYYIKRKSDSSTLRASIADYAPSVLVSKILPDAVGSSDGNIKVSQLVSATDPTATTTTPPANELYTTILAAVQAGAPGATLDQQGQYAQSFINSGYTDPTFVKTVTKDAYWAPDWRNVILVTESLKQAGITDLQQADTLAKIGIADPSYMKKILETGYTDVYLLNNLYGTLVNQPASTMAAVMNALSALPTGNLATLALGEIKVTDPAVAQQMFNAVSSVSVGWVQQGLIVGGWASDPVKVAAIAAAATSVTAPPVVMGGIAQVGISDPVLAQQLAAAVSVIPTWFGGGSDWIGHDLIVETNGDLAATQLRVNQYMSFLATNPTPTPAPTPVATPDPTAVTAVATPTPGPVEMTSLSVCTTCNAITF